MKSTKRLLRVSAVLPLFFGAGCADAHESIGHDESGSTVAGGATAASTASATTGGATGASSASYAFDKVGVDPTDATYTRSTALSPASTTGNCDTVSLTGTLDGQLVDQLYERDSLTEGDGTDGTVREWFRETWFGANGSAAIAGTTSDSNTLTLLGTAIPAQSGEVTLPMDLPRAKSFLCVTGASSMERAANQLVLLFPGIAFLADCESGTPVDGTIEFCYGSACPQSVLGDINGKFYDSSTTSYRSNGQSIKVATEALDVRTTYVATSATTATLKHSWLVDTATGAVYCAGTTSYAQASVVVEANGHRTNELQYHFRDLRSVGNCAQASGTDSLEVRVCTGAQ